MKNGYDILWGKKALLNRPNIKEYKDFYKVKEENRVQMMLNMTS